MLLTPFSSPTPVCLCPHMHAALHINPKYLLLFCHSLCASGPSAMTYMHTQPCTFILVSSAFNHQSLTVVLCNTNGSDVDVVASCSHCVQDSRHVMWSMLTGNEVACTCLYMYSSGGVNLSKGMLCGTMFPGDHELKYGKLLYI